MHDLSIVSSIQDPARGRRADIDVDVEIQCLILYRREKDTQLFVLLLQSSKLRSTAVLPPPELSVVLQ